MAEKAGTSGKTFDGLIPYLEKYKVPIYIGENLTEIADMSSENSQYLVRAFADIGYVAKAHVLESMKHGGRTRRKRGWIVAFEISVCRLTTVEASAKIDRIFDIVRTLETDMEPEAEFLLDDTHEYVLAVLAHAQVTSKKRRWP